MILSFIIQQYTLARILESKCLELNEGLDFDQVRKASIELEDYFETYLADQGFFFKENHPIPPDDSIIFFPKWGKEFNEKSGLFHSMFSTMDPEFYLSRSNIELLIEAAFIEWFDYISFVVAHTDLVFRSDGELIYRVTVDATIIQ